MSTPEILWPALRQYRHNSDNSPSLLDPEEGFVAAFDYDNTLAIVATLQSDLAAAKERESDLHRLLRAQSGLIEEQRQEIARAREALIKQWELVFTRSYSQNPIGRAEDRYAREIAQQEQPVKNTGNVIHDFWQLRSSQRRKIMTDLGLLEDGDMKTPEIARYNAAFLKALERGLLDQVVAKVAAHKGEEG